MRYICSSHFFVLESIQVYFVVYPKLSFSECNFLFIIYFHCPALITKYKYQHSRTKVSYCSILLKSMSTVTGKVST